MRMNEQIQKLSFKPGDVLVVKVGALLHRNDRAVMQESLQSQMGDIPVLVVDIASDVGVVPNGEATRYVQTQMGGGCGDMAWVCEECKCSWVFEYHPKDDGEMNYCPGCGRKIVEFVDYSEEQTCRVCGCTHYTPCEGGCYWVEPDLCSSCEGESEEEE